MIVSMDTLLNPFNLSGCIAGENIDHFIWLIKQFFIIVLTIVLFFGMKVASDNLIPMGVIDDKTIFLFIAVIACVNLLIFEVFYGCHYILIPYILLCLVNVMSFWILIFIFSKIYDTIRDVVKSDIQFNVIMYVFLSLFTLIHAIIVIRGNGAPKIICSIPNSDYLMPIGCDLSKARNGNYNYYVGEGNLYLVNKIDANGLFIELQVNDNTIVECNLFNNGKKVEFFYIPCTYVSDSYSTGSHRYITLKTDGLLFKGFDSDGKVIDGAHVSIPEGVSLWWGIVCIILLVLVIVFGRN
jgi:hypothetical protein